MDSPNILEKKVINKQTIENHESYKHTSKFKTTKENFSFILLSISVFISIIVFMHLRPVTTITDNEKLYNHQLKVQNYENFLEFKFSLISIFENTIQLIKNLLLTIATIPYISKSFQTIYSYFLRAFTHLNEYKKSLCFIILLRSCLMASLIGQ